MNWVNNSIFYHIYPIGFTGSPTFNDGVQAWRLDKVIEWIPHLKEMSVNAVYFGPVFESVRHGYDTVDYYKVDCRLGDNESFKKICNELHKNGIKIIIDGVFNHVGRKFPHFLDVQKNLQNSQYCNWFVNLNFNSTSPCGDPFSYEGWFTSYDLVKLNLNNEDVVNYLLGAVNMWIDEFDIDGLRLDAADCIDMNFFRRLHTVCKTKKPDFWLMGEISSGNYNNWINPDTLDSVTNYEEYKALYSCHNDKNYFEMAHSLDRQNGNYGIYKGLTLYNFADNHDVSRLGTILNCYANIKNVYTIVYTMNGVPSVYYGSEWGIKGKKLQSDDSLLRPCLDINNINDADYDLYSHIVKLGKIRTELDALKIGGFENVMIKNEQYVFCRTLDSTKVYIALNLSDNYEDVYFNSPCGSLCDKLNDNAAYTNNNGYKIDLPPHSSRILVGEF